MDLPLVLKFWKSDVVDKVESKVINPTPAAITQLELKQLLQKLSQVSDIRIRCKQSGEKFGSFMYVTVINSDSVILYDDQNSKRHQVPFSNINELEIDKAFQTFRSNFLYKVKVS